MKALLLSGGKGKRLFPLSRESYPKQYIPIFNGKSLIQMTIERFSEKDEIYIITNKNSYGFIKDLQKKLKLPVKTIFEPFSRNTASSIAYGIQFLDDEDVIGVFPVDHLIYDIKAFNECIQNAYNFIDESIVLIGIKPTRPETRFGYIQYSENNVISFKEKPDLELAKKYLESNQFLWNCGIFIFKKKLMMELLKKYQPEIFSISNKIKDKLNNFSFSNNQYFFSNPLIDELFNSFPSLSIDYAIIEKTDKLKVMKAKFDWDDVGNLDSLSKRIHGILKGNFGSFEPLENSQFFEIKENSVIKNNGDLNLKDENFNTIIGIKNKFYGIIGYSDCKIIDTKDTLLVMKNGEGDKVEKFYDWIESLKKNDNNKDDSKVSDRIIKKNEFAQIIDKIDETLKNHKIVSKPWGFYENIFEKSIEINEKKTLENSNENLCNNNYKVKRIKINKGEQISLQYHNNREEYWTIVNGKGKIIIDNKEYDAYRGLQFFVPKKAVHQAIASDQEDLEFVEVQLGEILSEDDIVRLSDKYNR